MRMLIGHSGLLGKTLQDSCQFDLLYNSKNIHEFRDAPEDCDAYLSCLPATKWLINKDPNKDMELALNLIELFKTKRFKTIVLFSTIDVYCDSPTEVDESFDPICNGLNYGSNRYRFEQMVANELSYDRLKILRLPALFGKHIKKNVLFDLLNNNQTENINLNSRFQWYDLQNLMIDVNACLQKEQVVFNLFPEPVETADIANLFPQYHLTNFGKRIDYNYKTRYSDSGYILSKETCLTQIQSFVNNYESIRKSTEPS